MAKNNSLDFAGAVLRKYPKARAVESEALGEWCIFDVDEFHPLSRWLKDRDAAWEDAYNRIYRKTST